MACPYEARYKVDEQRWAFGAAPTPAESARTAQPIVDVVTKCTFCVDRIDDGLARGLVPGVDPEATPVCAQSCISGAMRFGDIDDPQSGVSQLLAENRWFRMHESEGTGPGFYYLWDKEAPL
jgi:phenylacetyl-CoA:acceptor oxidoreductase subunit 1